VTPVILHFRLPMPENLTNRKSGRGHWRTIHSEKRKYQAMLDVLQSGGIIPPPPPAPLPKARLTSVMTLGGAMDDDNALARHKVAIDWLVKRGYLASDRRTCLTWTGLPTQRISRKNAPCLELTLEAA
jgi:hypothetical protein